MPRHHKLANCKKRACDCGYVYRPRNRYQNLCPLCLAKKEREELALECKIRKAERMEARRRKQERAKQAYIRRWNRTKGAAAQRKCYWNRKARLEAVKQVPR